jgi:hypothetical protein
MLCLWVLFFKLMCYRPPLLGMSSPLFFVALQLFLLLQFASVVLFSWSSSCVPSCPFSTIVMVVVIFMCYWLCFSWPSQWPWLSSFCSLLPLHGHCYGCGHLILLLIASSWPWSWLSSFVFSCAPLGHCCVFLCS